MSPSGIHLVNLGPLTGVATVFVTMAVNVICWAIFSGSKFVKGKFQKVEVHEVDIAFLYKHFKLERLSLK